MIKHLDHLNMTVADLDRTTDWYRRLFDFEVVEAGVWRGHRWHILKAGEAMLCLYEHPELTAPGTQSQHGLSHFALRINNSAAFQARAAREGVALQYGSPIRWPHSTSVYVEDPTGHEIEVVAWDDDTVVFAPAARAAG